MYYIAWIVCCSGVLVMAQCLCLWVFTYIDNLFLRVTVVGWPMFKMAIECYDGDSPFMKLDLLYL